MAFVPLSHEARLKGKAAIDGVGSRLGKSGGSLVYQFLLLIFGSVVGSTPVVAFLLIAAVIGWIYAVRSLGSQYQQLTADSPPLQSQAASRLS